MSHEYPLNVPAPHHFTFAVRDIPDVTVEQRERVLKATHYNEFAFPAGMLTVDMLSDSGTTAMTNQQWAALFLGDEAYGRNTGEQVSSVNLLLLETNISVISGDKEGRLKVRTTGEGDGLLCRNGQSVPIHWSRADRNSPFVYTTADGQPLALGRGNSYVCIMDPKTSKVECS